MLKWLKDRLIGDPSHHPNFCFGQNAEDLILDRILENQEIGFYVDIGAHHPIRFSNTYLFYLRGWRGINIDAMPGSMQAFQKLRPRDLNIERGVAGKSGELTYFQFNELALNTFDEKEAKLKNRTPYELIGSTKIRVQRLDEILDEHLPKAQEIDFLNIDVEGLDAEVLRSNNWSKYRPRFLLVEMLHGDLLDLGNRPEVGLLAEVGYSPITKAYDTVIFKRQLS